MDITLKFAEIKINNERFNKDVIILYNGEILRRPKHLSKPLADQYNHTPFSLEEAKKVFEMIKGVEKLVIGNGLSGRMYVIPEALDYLKNKGLNVEVYQSEEAIKRFLSYVKKGEKVALLVHITC